MYFLMNFLFIVGVSAILYTYGGYALVALLIKKLRKPKVYDTHSAPFEPEVSLIVAAYNEEDIIEDKIRNCLQLDYPKQKLQLLFITDGSTDRTTDIISHYKDIKLFHRPERKGKTAALNRVMRLVTTPIVIFCDANTLLNSEAIKYIVKHYQDPSVGGVAGEKKVVGSGNEDVAGAGEGAYWKYESLLKKIDSDCYSVVGAAGELFSIRTSLYTEVEPNVILDDFVISLRICEKGYRIKYEPEAYAVEAPSANIQEERKRKIRICAGGFQAMVILKKLLNPVKYPLLSFLYISHRVFRWTLAPLSLILVFLSNLYLVVFGSSVIFSIAMAAQALFYILAALGYYYQRRKYCPKIFFVPYYFTFMNYSIFAGFARYLRGAQSSIWEKSLRSKMA